MAFGWNDVGRLLADIAPTIAGGLVSIAPGGGFLSPVVAMGVRELEKALGIGSAAGEPPATPEQMAEALSATSPETLLKLREADNAYKAKCLDAGVDLERIAAADRDSARQREVAVKDSTPKVLAGLVTLGFFGLLGLMAFHELPAENREALAIMLGTLAAGWAGVVTYYFGSSAGERKSAAALSEIAKR